MATFDEEDIVQPAHQTGLAFKAALAPLVERYEMFHEVRGEGLMIGLEFGAPQSKALRRRFNTLERMRPAIFSQMMVVPLFHRHRILTQVAADNVNIIKLLPPLICGQEEIDYFVDALDDVLKDAHSGSGLALRVRPHHGQGRAAQDREGPPGRACTSRYLAPTTATATAMATDSSSPHIERGRHERQSDHRCG